MVIRTFYELIYGDGYTYFGNIQLYYRDLSLQVLLKFSKITIMLSSWG